MPSEATVTIVEYLDSDAGAVAAEAALRAADVPYVLARPTGTWSGVPARMKISVPADRLDEASATLKEATLAGALVSAKGEEGLHTW